jgi:hypothetical protein
MSDRKPTPAERQTIEWYLRQSISVLQELGTKYQDLAGFGWSWGVQNYGTEPPHALLANRIAQEKFGSIHIVSELPLEDLIILTLGIADAIIEEDKNYPTPALLEASLKIKYKLLNEKPSINRK